MADNELSFFAEEQEPMMVPIKSDKIVRNNNPIFYQTSKDVGIDKSTVSRCMNILTQNKVSTKLQVNQEFFDFLANDKSNSEVAIVSFLGPKKVGKSFLVDCLISCQEKTVNREMTKNNKPIINMPTRSLFGRGGEKILLFDCNSSIANETFLWVYFNSSVVVVNLNPLDRSGEEDFIKNLSFVQSHLDSDPEDLSLPKLIMLRRDSQSNDFQQQEFLRRVKDYGLFQSDIITLNMRYPGSVTVKTKEIMDVPESALNKNYMTDVINLYNVIKNQAKSKHISGNVLGTKILSLSLDPLTRAINKQRKVNTIKIWDDVIETLSVGYYNYYILKYTEQLQNQFEDQKPCDKYTLYKKLSSVRRRVDKKVEGFNTISGDPIFQKYRGKLLQKIQSKENIIKEINSQKSRRENDKYCKTLFKELNDSNCAQLIQQYCQSTLDDQKDDVLLENFQSIINQRIKDMEKSKDPSKKPSKEIQMLEEELRKIEKQIQDQKKLNIAAVAYDFNELQSTVSNKQKELQKLQKDLQQQKQISENKKSSQSKDIVVLENSIRDLKQKTQTQEKQINALRAERQKKVQQMAKDLQKKLKQEQEKLAQIQEAIRKSKQTAIVIPPRGAEKGAEKGAKNNSCCQIM